jgi:hypothetical protein
MASSNANILYIAGASRSGSTLLARLLNQVPAFWHVGELHHLWKRAIGRDEPCECGVLFSECAFWREVLPRVLGEDVASQVTHYRRMKHLAEKPWRYPASVRWILRLGNTRRAGHEYADVMSRLCGEACEVADASIAIDSSKSPAYIAAQLAYGKRDAHVLHLVRDPRAVAWSLQRRRERPDGKGGVREMPREDLQSGAKLWVRENVAAAELQAMTRSYQLMRYEDLVANPVAALTPVLDALGIDGSELSFISGRTAMLHQGGHAIAGNPMKFDSGQLAIRADDAWKTEMPETDRNAVERIAGRAMAQLGY